MYFDTSYLAKFYLNEPEQALVHRLVLQSGPVRTSALAYTELHCVIHRLQREGQLTAAAAREMAAEFNKHIDHGLWSLAPASEAFLRRTAALVLAAPADVFLRTVDAIHLTTAKELGESEIWTSDRHMLAAAPYFGLRGRTV